MRQDPLFMGLKSVMDFFDEKVMQEETGQYRCLNLEHFSIRKERNFLEGRKNVLRELIVYIYSFYIEGMKESWITGGTNPAGIGHLIGA